MAASARRKVPSSKLPGAVTIDAIVHPTDFFGQIELNKHVMHMQFLCDASPDLLFMCNGTKLDVMHTYKVSCIGDGRRNWIYDREVVEIANIIGETRNPFTAKTLLPVCRKHFPQLVSTIEIDMTANNKSQAATANPTSDQAKAMRGELGGVIRIFGELPWYRRLEAYMPVYFQEWYTESIGAYNFETLQGLGTKRLGELVRVAALDPYKLCLWNKHSIDTLDSISVAMGDMLARQLGPTNPQAVPAYRYVAELAANPKFIKSRSMGSLYIPVETYKCLVPDANVRSLLVSESLVKYRKKVDESRVVSVMEVGLMSDILECTEVARALVEVLSTPSTVNMLYETECWPFANGNGIVLTPEQSLVVHALRVYPILLVNGNGGTGKTSVCAKSCVDMYPHGTVLAVAATGAAVEHFVQIIGSGVQTATIDKVIEERKRLEAGQTTEERCRFRRHRVLIVEEASTISISMLRMLLSSLPCLERIYMFGDTQQLDPVCGNGIGAFESLLNHYKGSPIAFTLRTSKRVLLGHESLSRNLDAISAYNGGRAVPYGSSEIPPLSLEYELEPTPESSTVFLGIGSSVDHSTRIMCEAFERCNEPITNPNSSYMVIAHTNDLCAALCRGIYSIRAKSTSLPFYRQHRFHANDRIIFKKNHYRMQPSGSQKMSDDVMNGTIGTVSTFIDEDMHVDPVLPRQYAQVEDMDAPKSFAEQIRWICFKRDDGISSFVPLFTDCADVRTPLYPEDKISHAYAVTEYKSQGAEANVVVFYVPPVDPEHTIRTRKGLYTSCSRARKTLIVLGNLNASKHAPCREPDALRPCPCDDFACIVQGSVMNNPGDAFDEVLPGFAELVTKFSAAPRLVHRKTAPPAPYK